MSFSKVLISVICLFITLSRGVTDDEICSYVLEDAGYNVTYTIADSLLQMPYFGNDLSAPRTGFRDGIAGVNTNGTIYIVGGRFAYDIRDDDPAVETANRFVWITKSSIS